MKVANLKDLYLTELQEAWSFENQLADTLAGLGELAEDDRLKGFFTDDLEESRNHREQVAALLERHDAKTDAHHDQSMHVLIDEARKWGERIDEAAVRDAALIASAQRMQHYQMAVYGTLAAWAKHQDLAEDVEALGAILEDEKKTDKALSHLAENTVNLEAA